MPEKVSQNVPSVNYGSAYSYRRKVSLPQGPMAIGSLLSSARGDLSRWEPGKEFCFSKGAGRSKRPKAKSTGNKGEEAPHNAPHSLSWGGGRRRLGVL